MSDSNLGLGEQALSRAAELVINTQLTESESLTIDVHAPGLMPMQGEATGVHIEGKGLTFHEMRVEAVEVQTEAVSIDPLRALVGDIHLSQPVAATARLVLKAEDLNRALNTPTALAPFQGVTLPCTDKPGTLDVLAVHLDFPAAQKMTLEVRLNLGYVGEPSQTVAFTAGILVDSNLCIQEMHFLKGYELPLELAGPLMQRISILARQRAFSWQGMAFQVHDLQVEPGAMVITSAAQIAQMPS
ncbi:DUF2993 domain-containing protein [Candidatus Cyanaurora vandensis]|uniref:LmeA family phospholipid-binding protein n=1 Tax=Candidatus Cyanaurora vandensis TaxID=2714958 RepID=UPI00257A1A48|nr:DUF2993 domain-containing protein [Candidatus Cyanaurora vandensis]